MPVVVVLKLVPEPTGTPLSFCQISENPVPESDPLPSKIANILLQSMMKSLLLFMHQLI